MKVHMVSTQYLFLLNESKKRRILGSPINLIFLGYLCLLMETQVPEIDIPSETMIHILRPNQYSPAGVELWRERGLEVFRVSGKGKRSDHVGGKEQGIWRSWRSGAFSIILVKGSSTQDQSETHGFSRKTNILDPHQTVFFQYLFSTYLVGSELVLAGNFVAIYRYHPRPLPGLTN